MSHVHVSFEEPEYTANADDVQKTYDYFKALPPSGWTKLPKELISK